MSQVEIPQRKLNDPIRSPKHVNFKPIREFYNNDYSNNYIHTNSYPQKHVTNIENTVEGYPKLQKLFQEKTKQNANYATKPYCC